MAVPFLDAPLVSFSTNFNARGVVDPEMFGLTPEQMELYTPLHEAWLAAWNDCNVEGGKCPSLVARKNTAKKNLLRVARMLYGRIQSNKAVSDEAKSLMGVVIRTNPVARIAPPELAPLLTLLSVSGRTATFKINDAASPTTRRRPRSAAGATIQSYVGDTHPPVGGPAWKLERQVGRNRFQVQFASSVAPDATCWVSARWYSRRGEYSPPSQPIRLFLQIGGSLSQPQQPCRADAKLRLQSAA